jgi:alkylated DNA repair dioxygenase AlkB
VASVFVPVTCGSHCGSPSANGRLIPTIAIALATSPPTAAASCRDLVSASAAAEGRLSNFSPFARLAKTYATKSMMKGCVLRENYITPEEHTALQQYILRQPWDKTLVRETQHYGFRYNYDTKTANQATTPIPAEFTFLVNRLEADYGCTFDQCIVNKYLPGQGIGMHTDHKEYFGNIIVSVSLESAIVMDFDKPFSKESPTSLVLPPCSALVLSGEARWEWRHGIAGRKRDPPPVGERGRRISLTFRSMMQK